jgi:hypothetical protein
VTLLSACAAPARAEPLGADASATFYFSKGTLELGCELPLGGVVLAGAPCPVKMLLANGTSRAVPSATVALRRTVRAVAQSPVEIMREKTESVSVEQTVALPWAGVQ